MSSYAKLIDGHPEWVPNPVKVDGYTVSNPGPDIMASLGYKKVIYPEPPSDPEQIIAEASNNMIPVYTEEEGCIRVSYVEGEPVPQPNPEQLREMAYRAEADQCLLAYEGYLAEDKVLEADGQKALYLAKKAEIRERYSDIINELEAWSI